MKNAEEILNEIKAEKIIEVSKLQAKIRDRKERIEKFVNSIFDKYDKVIENDLKTLGRVTFDLDAEGYHFKNTHVVPSGDINSYDCIVKMRKVFMDLGYVITSFGYSTITAELPERGILSHI